MANEIPAILYCFIFHVIYVCLYAHKTILFQHFFLLYFIIYYIICTSFLLYPQVLQSKKDQIIYTHVYILKNSIILINSFSFFIIIGDLFMKKMTILFLFVKVQKENMQEKFLLVNSNFHRYCVSNFSKNTMFQYLISKIISFKNPNVLCSANLCESQLLFFYKYWGKSPYIFYIPISFQG